jgi:hypothetical protein
MTLRVIRAILGAPADVGYYPQSDRTRDTPQRSRRATFGRTHLQQQQRAFRPEQGERRHRPADRGVI